MDLSILLAAAFGVALVEFAKGIIKHFKPKSNKILWRVLVLPAALIAGVVYKLAPDSAGYVASIFSCMTLGYDNVIIFIQSGITRITGSQGASDDKRH